MHRFFCGCLLVLVHVAIRLPIVRAAEPTVFQINGVLLTPELVDAYRDYALARQQLLRYRQVVLPLQRQELDRAGELTSKQIAVLVRRLRDYNPFLAVGDYSPVRTAAENDNLALVAAKQNLERIRAEKIALMRYGYLTDEVLQIDVVRAVLRVHSARRALGN